MKTGYLSGVHAVGARVEEPQSREERRENRASENTRAVHHLVTSIQAAGTGLPLRPSRLCGLSGLSSTAWLRLSQMPLANLTSRHQGLVPEGQQTIAQRFSVGSTAAHEPSPEGTVEDSASGSGVNRPYGTYLRAALNPTLKRWAILMCPFGTRMQSDFRATLRLILLLLCALCTQLSTRAEQTNQEATIAESLVISTAKPLLAKEKKLREAVYNLCKEMLNAPAGKFGAHPSAAVFPGPVAKDAPRISKTLKMKHVPPPPEMMPLIKPLDYSDPFAPYFTAWGIPLTAELKQDLAKYPEWMPYDFPPKAL